MLFRSGIRRDSSVHRPLKFYLPTGTFGIRIFVLSTETYSTGFRELSIIVNLHFLIPDHTKRPDLSCDSNASWSSISSPCQNPAAMPGINLRHSLTLGAGVSSRGTLCPPIRFPNLQPFLIRMALTSCSPCYVLSPPRLDIRLGCPQGICCSER
jgi:hypothetical protein